MSHTGHGTLPGLGHPQHARPRAGGVSRSGVAASFGRSQRSTAAGPSGAGFGRTGAEDKLPEWLEKEESADLRRTSKERKEQGGLQTCFLLFSSLTFLA